MLDRIVNFERV